MNNEMTLSFVAIEENEALGKNGDDLFHYAARSDNRRNFRI